MTISISIFEAIDWSEYDWIVLVCLKWICWKCIVYGLERVQIYFWQIVGNFCWKQTCWKNDKDIRWIIDELMHQASNFDIENVPSNSMLTNNSSNSTNTSKSSLIDDSKSTVESFPTTDVSRWYVESSPTTEVSKPTLEKSSLLSFQSSLIFTNTSTPKNVVKERVTTMTGPGKSNVNTSDSDVSKALIKSNFMKYKLNGSGFMHTETSESKSDDYDFWLGQCSCVVYGIPCLGCPKWYVG